MLLPGYAHAPLYPPGQLIQQEAGKSHARDQSVLYVYNFCKIHKSLRVTPVIAAGVSKTLWEISDIVALIPKEVPKMCGS
jgi:hypothetical protein